MQADKDDLINDAAAIAESIQPKGNTLSSTEVVTPVPFLLRHTLREYQVSDWSNLMMHHHNAMMNLTYTQTQETFICVMITHFTEHLNSVIFTIFVIIFDHWMISYEAFVWLLINSKLLYSNKSVCLIFK